VFLVSKPHLSLFKTCQFILHFNISHLLRGFEDKPILHYFSPTYKSFVNWFNWKAKHASANGSVCCCKLTEHRNIDLRLIIAVARNKRLSRLRLSRCCYRAGKGLIELGSKFSLLGLNTY
jgi:hypothetical protein